MNLRLTLAIACCALGLTAIALGSSRDSSTPTSLTTPTTSTVASDLDFIPDAGVRKASASMQGAGIDSSGTVYLYYHDSNTNQDMVATAADGLTFGTGTVVTYANRANDARRTLLPDGTWRLYQFDEPFGILTSHKSTAGIAFVADPGTRYTPVAADVGWIGELDAFTEGSSVVLLYLGDKFGVNNMRRAISTDNGVTFTFDKADLLGDAVRGGGSNSYVDPRSIRLSDGRRRLFVMKNNGRPDTTIDSFISSNGLDYTLEAGNRLKLADFTSGTVTTLNDPEVVQLADGRYRMYVAGMVGINTGAFSIFSATTTLVANTLPAISTEPSSQSVTAGANATLTVAASGEPSPTYQWQVSTDSGVSYSSLSNASPYSGVTTATLTVTTATVSLNGARYRAVATNVVGSATSTAAMLTVYGAMSVSYSALRYGAAKTTSSTTLADVTPAQTVTVTFTGASGSWVAASNASWLEIGRGTGTGAGSFTAAIVNPSNLIGGSTTLTATITVTSSTATNTPQTSAVTLTVKQVGATAASFGQIDTPVQNATGVQGAIGVTGWTIDDIGVASVKIYRTCLAFDIAASCQSLLGSNVVYIGDAAFLAGARPDVEAAFSTYPQAYRGGWGMQVLSTLLPHVPSQWAYGGQGALAFYAFATDEEGNVTLLGREQSDHTPTSVTLANDTIAKPFGTIDTPGQGGTVSGMVANFGWVLTPDLNTTADGTDVLVPINGSTMRVIIDGAVAGTVTYNQCRGNVGNPVPAGAFCNDDIASIFGDAMPRATFTARTANATRYRNLDAARAAIGSFDLNTTTLTNGLHTIAWGVVDSANRAEGIGSRFFTVLNTGADSPAIGPGLRPAALRDAPAQSRGLASSLDGLPFSLDGVSGRRGFDFTASLTPIAADAAGVGRVTMAEMNRLELALGAVTTGYLVANDTLRDLPPGSRLETSTGVFTWVPGPGYVGTYRLVFMTSPGVRGAGVQIPIDVTIRPPVPAREGESEIRMYVDGAVQLAVQGPALRPSTPLGAGERSVRVEGWGLDPDAFTGSGIGAVHVWARRLDLPTVGPEFLGAATLNVARPDVAAAFGASFHSAGFELTSSLAPGRWEITAYVWNQRTARWEDARTVLVTVR